MLALHARIGLIFSFDRITWVQGCKLTASKDAAGDIFRAAVYRRRKSG